MKEKLSCEPARLSRAGAISAPASEMLFRAPAREARWRPAYCLRYGARSAPELEALLDPTPGLAARGSSAEILGSYVLFCHASLPGVINYYHKSLDPSPPRVLCW